MNQFIHVETKEVVRILSDEGNFLTLNNGMKIDKQLFSQKYAATNNNGDSMDPENFLNQKTTYNQNKNVHKNVHENVQQEPNINTNVAIDPIDFLNSTKMKVDGLDGIKKIDTTKHLDIPDDQGRVTIKDKTNEVVSIQTTGKSLEEQKKELLAKYNNNQSQQIPGYVDENDPNAVDQMIKNYKKPEKKTVLNENGLTEHQERMRQQHMELKNGEDPYAEKIRKYRLSKGLPPEPVKSPTKPVVVENNETQNEKQHYIQPQVEDPTISLFKKFKRNHKITINLKIKDSISKPDFIKVMADGLEGDIIQYYTDEIYKIFVSEPSNIKKEIYNQVYKNVYDCLPDEDEDIIEESKEVKKRKIPNVSKHESSQLNEDVSEKVEYLISGKPTKTGKKTFKYLNNKGKIVDMIPLNAEKKGYKPATKKDLK